MLLGIRNSEIAYFFVSLIILITLHFWSFQSIDDDIYTLLDTAVLGLIIIIAAAGFKVFLTNDLSFKWYTLGFVFLPFLGVIGANIYHDQAIGQSVYMIRNHFFWLFYFVLHIMNVPRKRLINVMLFVGAVWAFLTIIQQYTYPHYYFFSRDDENKSIYRAGVYRYMLNGQHYGLFFLLFFFYQYLRTEKIKILAFVLFALAGFYFYGTRQFAIAAVVCMGLAVFLLNGNARWKNLLILGGLALFALGFKELLFGDYIELTSSQLEYGDDIRLLSGNFYLNDYWPSWSAKLLGNGRQHHASSYGQEIDLLQQAFHFYRSDIGIVGAYSYYGIFYVINMIGLNIKGITIKIKNEADKYLRLIFVNSAILLIISDYYSSPKAIIFYCLVFYLIDKSRSEYKKVKAGVAA